MAFHPEYSFTDFVDVAPEGVRLLGPESREGIVGVMALVHSAESTAQSGIARVISSRFGSPSKDGFVDRSRLRHVKMAADGERIVGDELYIEGAAEQGQAVAPDGYVFSDIEDPTICGSTVFYTSVARKRDNPSWVEISLGRAVGDSLDSLVAQAPVLRDAKEACVGPVNHDGTRIVWVESSASEGYSTLAAARTSETFEGEWEDLGTMVHPATVQEQFQHFSYPDIPTSMRHAWCAEHISPCQVIDRSDLDLGNGLVVMIINGRSVSQWETFGPFRIGIGVANPETGEMVWVDPLPMYENRGHENIYFASEWGVIDKDRVIAHVDDTYVTSIELSRDRMLARIPAQLLGKRSIS